MNPSADDNSKAEMLGLEAPQFDALVAGWGLPKFRAQQVREWVYGRAVTDVSAMSNLSRLDRDKLSALLSIASSRVATHQKSEDGTQKLLLEWGDPAKGGQQAETVMIPDADRRTACVSSQVGCPVGCKFCASGMEGVKGNLTAGQIVEQVVRLNEQLKLEPLDRGRPQKINSIVFMGMGEPLANYANVMAAIRVLHDPAGLNISARKITISTVGVPKRIKDLADEALPLNLAISLHAPTEGLRKSLIPWAEHFSIDEILASARYYFDRTGREITFEYILLSGVNDKPEHARELSQLCRTLRANVNLLRYNEVESLPFKRPKSDSVMQFQEVLRRNGINAHVRKSRGRDITAACGQLRRRENEKNEGNESLVQLGA
jgi:23S rRNA (adenine2503-C2)-methyltransferase